MIRRHFLAGIVGIKSMCAVAALAIGAGQAEAATFLDIKFTLNSAVREYSPIPEEGGDEGFEDVFLDEFWGVKVGETVDAVFSFDNFYATLTTAAGTIFSGWAYGSAPYEIISEDSTSVEYTWLTWDGMFSGTMRYSYDGRPWFTVANATWTAQPAPVPLPASAALLPLGIGALVMMRRRRKV